LLPAIIFQSVFMGGGFTTGREIMEYCGKYGTLGIYSILGATLGFLISTVLSYELARVTKSFDYRSLMKQILWKAWPAFEISYIILAIIVIAVVGSAAASIFEDMTGIPYIVGAIVVIALVGILHFWGRAAIEWFETVGTVILYIMYAILWAITIVATWGHASEVLSSGLAEGTPSDTFVAGIQYFCLQHGCYTCSSIHSRQARGEKGLSHGWILLNSADHDSLHTDLAINTRVLSGP